MSSYSKVNEQKEKKIKCVTWDIDNTLWDGILLENKNVTLCEGIIDIIKTLDNRGIIQSIASKNNYIQTMDKLKALKISEYFLYPQINWNSKSSSIKKIAELINIGLDTVAFIDDQQYELDEVSFSLPQVMCINVNDISKVIDTPEFNPRFITEDSHNRRQMYINDINRKKDEEDFIGPKEEFLSSLDMVFKISPATDDDLKRAEELTLRTHQLNTTGYTYSIEELSLFRKSDNHMLLMACLGDKYGTYGKIGLGLVECGSEVWTIKLLLMSCRVMSRGVGSVLINHIISMSKKNNVRLCAEFVTNDRNRMMYITYKFSGFHEIGKKDDVIILEHNMEFEPKFPKYMKVIIES
ncbi:HAD-IIIC family phosphatase [Clostridium frigidicarnis]|uniref:HAD-superfamily phosphatase, subfamily IIIC/FkbH-like domain-containing protein n=1 Tax=Clostridium frigidicarnis TaxID=84698 RepID=A0A1I0Y4D4_9CLOT|nr:HAD-IIIC family phosphatase [Clostridium frigidicarnis]SFB07707.1 HAD-superfamily phosphatase, subfamily IIIC/FkbH-like domain-containing protein [Clostridium frigidicarnis]